MKVPPPDWIGFQRDEAGGIDLLGLRAPAQAISSQLFDGITSVTPKIRYLSLLIWGIWMYSRAKLPASRSGLIQWVAKQEAVFVMANRLYDDRPNNLVGAIAAKKVLDAAGAWVTLTKLTQQIAYNAYISTLISLEFAAEMKNGFHLISNERGKPLAEAFGTVINQTVYGRRLERKPQLEKVRRDELNELSIKLSVTKVPAREREILIEAVIPRHPTSQQMRRLRHYALLLWLAASNESDIDEATVFAAAQHPSDQLPACLSEAVDGWLSYIIRDVLAVCHEAVLGAVRFSIEKISNERAGPAVATEVVASLLANTAEQNDVLQSFGLLKRGESIERISFRTFWERVQRRCKKQAKESNGLRRWQEGLSEIEIYEHAQSSPEAAVTLLPLAWCLACHRVVTEAERTPFQEKLLILGGALQMGMEAVVIPKLKGFLRQDYTLRQVMSVLIFDTVQQHLKIAWTRFAAPNGKDVSVLSADVELWSLRGDFRPGRTNSRLDVAIDWLRQLELLDNDGPTQSGHRILKRSLKILEAT